MQPNAATVPVNMEIDYEQFEKIVACHDEIEQEKVQNLAHFMKFAVLSNLTADSSATTC